LALEYQGKTLAKPGEASRAQTQTVLELQRRILCGWQRLPSVPARRERTLAGGSGTPHASTATLV